MRINVAGDLSHMTGPRGYVREEVGYGDAATSKTDRQEGNKEGIYR